MTPIAYEVPPARERAAEGAVYLDGASPGWAKRIDPELLNMEDPCLCSLAQATGMPYWDAIEELGLVVDEDGNGEVPVRLGFQAAANPESEDGVSLDIDHLHAAWVGEIRRRRVASS